MSISGGYVLLPKEIEILRELETINGKEILNSQFMLIIKHLRSESAHVRAKCVRVMGECVEPHVVVPFGRWTVFELVQWHKDDRDARVREAVLGVCADWLSLGSKTKAEKSGLEEFCEMVEGGVRDCEAEVVITALRLVLAVARVAGFDMVDWGFGVAARCIGHPCGGVRREAMRVVRGLPGGVSEAVLLGTLEKAVMVDRVMRRGGERGEEEALAVGGTIGALVAGLEDDYYEIRLQTVVSMGNLSLQYPKFALACQDLLVDMLTDDIEAVRAAAVTNLSLASGIRHNMTLRSDQLDIILSVLDEKSGAMRRSIHSLLGGCRLASAGALLQLLGGLMRNLTRYEMDRDSIWRCAASVGKHHPEFVQVGLEGLLRLHPYLLSKQGVRSDPEYVSVLLMVGAAARGLPAIRAGLPRHIREHQAYLQELLPQLLPPVQAVNKDYLNGPPAKMTKYNPDDTNTTEDNPTDSRQDLHSRLRETMSSLHSFLLLAQPVLRDHEFVTLQETVSSRRLQSELKQISRLCPETRGLCLWLRDLGKVTTLCRQRPLALTPLCEARALCSKMAQAYTGLSDQDRALLASVGAAIGHKIDCLNSRDFLPTREIKEELSSGPPLHTLGALSPLASCATLPSISHVSATQLHPTALDTERSAVRFCAGMGVSVPVRAEVRGLDLETVSGHNGDNVIVKTPLVVVVSRPDSKELRWQPPDRCWSLHRHHGNIETLLLDTEVPLSLSEWSEPGMIQIGLAVLLPDVDGICRLTEQVGLKVFPVAPPRAL